MEFISNTPENEQELIERQLDEVERTLELLNLEKIRNFQIFQPSQARLKNKLVNKKISQLKDIKRGLAPKGQMFTLF